MSIPIRIPIDYDRDTKYETVTITPEIQAQILAPVMKRITALEHQHDWMLLNGSWASKPTPVAADGGCESWGHKGPFYNGWCETCRKDRAAVAADKPLPPVWVVTFRETLDQEVVAHVASSEDRALQWMRGQKAADWQGGWFAVAPEVIDGEEPGRVNLYDIAGNEIEGPPIVDQPAGDGAAVEESEYAQNLSPGRYIVVLHNPNRYEVWNWCGRHWEDSSNGCRRFYRGAGYSDGYLCRIDKVQGMAAEIADLRAKLAEATVWEKHAEDAMRRARIAEDKVAELERERDALKDRLEELRYR